MNKQFEQDMAIHGSGNGRLPLLGGVGARLRGWKLAASAFLLGSAAALGVAPAWAGVAPDSDIKLNFGTQTDVTDVPQGVPFTASIDWQRTSAGVDDTLTVVIPAQLEATTPLPAGCSFDPMNAAHLVCTVANGAVGATGQLSIGFIATSTGGPNISVIGSDPGKTTAVKPVVIRSSGDLKVEKQKTSPAGNAVAGMPIVFEISPQIDGNGMDVPVGGSIVVTDKLPTDFQLTAVNAPPGAVCNSVSDANTSRTLVCTYSATSAPISPAALATGVITVTGKQNSQGTFVNIATIKSGSVEYLDTNDNNNDVNLPYTTAAGTDLVAKGSYDEHYKLIGSDQPLKLEYYNDGPSGTTGGTIQTIIPAGFVIKTLPANCTSAPGNSLQVNGSTYSGTLVTCTPGTVAAKGSQSFDLILTLPGAPTDGQFPVVVTPPADSAETNPSNNSILLPYQVAEPFADLGLTKTKSPGGPQAPGTVVTTRLTVTNDQHSLSPADHTTNPLKVVDYMRPEEIAGGVVTVKASSPAGWTCAVTRTGLSNPPYTNDGRSTEVTCTAPAGTLAPGASKWVEFTTTIDSVTSPIKLVNYACTGASALTALGVPNNAGPSPADPFTANDCEFAGGTLVATPVDNGKAEIKLVKDVSFQPVASNDWYPTYDAATKTPRLLVTDQDLVWRMTVTRPTAGQETIPTLHLTDDLPGILNMTSPGAPAEDFKTPAIAVTVTRNGVPSSTECPATLAAGERSLTCEFLNVLPTDEIVVMATVRRPLAGTNGDSVLTNSATMTSPDAILSGQITDTAAIYVEPRLDVAMKEKKVQTAEPKVGGLITFALSAQNLGPGAIPVGMFSISDEFFVGTPIAGNGTTAGDGTVAYENISGTGSGMSCAAPVAIAGQKQRITCTNTTPVPAYEVRTITLTARIKKPASGLPAKDGTVYLQASNSAVLTLDPSLCEFKTETSTNPQVSGSCGDVAATSNNTASATFDIKAPVVDLVQKKVPWPSGTKFRLGDNLRYKFTVSNDGTSRAEEVMMYDVLSPIPAGYTIQLLSPGVVANPEFGGNATPRVVQCTQPTGPNGRVECELGGSAADNWLDRGQSVSFVLEFAMVGPVSANGPLTFGDAALACANENAYELQGACDAAGFNRTNFENKSFDIAKAGNNLVSIPTTVFPPVDLAIDKTTITTGPVKIGQPVEYSLVVTNNGPSSVTKIRVKDLLPKGFEWLNTSTYVPTVDGTALAVRNSAPGNGVYNVCYISNGVTTVNATSAGQEITCDLDGNYALGASVTVKLWARAKPGVYNGSANFPFNSDRTNTGTVTPGMGSDGSTPVALDTDPSNDSDPSETQVASGASLAGLVFFDRNDNGDVDGAGDIGLSGSKITLSGNDQWGAAVSMTTTTDGNGNYKFENLPPSGPAGYTLTQDQTTVATSYQNGLPRANEPRANRNGLSTGVTHAAGFVAENPAGGTTSVIAGLVLAHDAVGVEFDFPEIKQYSLSGFVFADYSRNDVYVAGGASKDMPIAGATVELLEWDSLTSAYKPTGAPATTLADGSYSFTGLSASKTYALRQPLPAPTSTVTYFNLESAVKPGTIEGVACATTVCQPVPASTSGDPAFTDRIEGIKLTGDGANFNFGETVGVSVSGTVFYDVNNDGVKASSGEPGIAGVEIKLVGTDDLGQPVNRTYTTVAADNGAFKFEGLRPGTYTLVEPEQPTGTAQGITTAGKLTSTSASSGTASNNASPESSKIADINLLTPGDASNENLFGEIPTNSGISGKVWLDTNNDGVIDPGETGIAGVVLELSGTDVNNNPVSRTFTTLADGEYAFLNLPPGTYKVEEKNQAVGTLDGKTKIGNIGGAPKGMQGQADGTATVSDPSNIFGITVGVGEFSVQNNFGEIPAGLISGFVYNDGNDDGIKDSDEGGYAGITITLTGTDDLGNPVTSTVTTNPDGSYSFPDLRPGTYEVTEGTPPPETLNGKTTGGAVGGGVGSNPTPTSSVITGIVLTPGTQSVDNNFGEIGDSPDMLVSKSSNTVKFTVNNVATYTIRVRNGGQKPSFGEYIVKDRLPMGLSLADVPAGNGWLCSGAVGDTRFECRSSEVVNAGATSLSDITVKANVSAEAAKAGTVNNAVLIEGGGENEFRTPTTTERNTFEGDVSTLPVCDTAITQNVCRVPNQVQLSSSVGGTVWFDVGSEDTFLDGGDKRLQSWIVELLDSVTGVISQSTITAVDGSYRFADVIPGVKWNIQFRDPSSGVLWAWPVNQETAGGMGVACDSPLAIGNDGVSACRVSENGTSQLQVVLEAGQHLPQQSLPVDPSGVVYDAVTRDPVPGSIVTLAPVGVCTGYDPNTAILNAGAGGYRVEGNAVSMTVGNNGYYQFMFGPAAPARCEFQLTVTPPGGYKFVSSLIPAETGSLSPLGAAGSSHLVQPQTDAPTGAVGTPTQYWLNLFAGSAVAGVVHNHIPLDTAEATGLVITKTGDRQTAEIGDTVQYTITVRQTAGSAMATVNIVDTLPRGFTYINGTGRVGGRAVEDPLGKPGPRLGFDLGPIDVGQQLVLTYRVRVGVGAQQGDGINRAQAHGCSITGGCIDPGSMTPVPGSVPSNRAEYRVRVTGGVFTEEACVLGKIFVDCNNNHVQDEEELGIPGVRMYFSNGTWMISDSEGKYSYCGLPPQSHTLKVDPSTLPVGARLTTSSNRNLGDADSLFLDLKNGELHRADFVEGSCANPLLEQVKARRTQGEVRAPETETGQSQLRFDSKPVRAPQQATDSSNQRPIVQPRPNPPSAPAQQEVQP